MSYIYSDPTRETDPHALPDVEVFTLGECKEDHASEWFAGIGWYFAFGFPGCLWDSDPIGPFNTEQEAINAARES